MRRVSRLTATAVSAMLFAVVLVAAGPAGADESPPVFAMTWGTNGTGDGQFDRPGGVAVDTTTGSVYVADTYNHRIQKFTSDGTFVTKWGTFGTGDSQFNYPLGVAVDTTTGSVYVADTYNHRIQKFTSDGTFVTKWGTSGAGNGQLNYPQGIAIDTAGSVYVTDTYNFRVQKFSATGAYLAQWGSRGSDDGQFNYAAGVAVDAGDGHVYVVDLGNYRIQEFTSTGGFVRKWGHRDNDAGGFEDPEGVAVDADGNVYVADTGNHRLQKFTTDGVHLTSWGTGGSTNGEFNRPAGVAVDADGDIYVADPNNYRIQRFAPAAPAVSMAKSADESSVLVGETIHLHLQVTNDGNVALTGVTVTDADAPGCAGPVADIAVGASRTIDCTRVADVGDAPTYANTATVDTDQTAPVSSNTVEVTVVSDVTDPTVELVTPPEGAFYALGEVVNAGYSCDDGAGGSGIASCVGTVATGSPIDTSTSGDHDFTVTATDVVGNTAEATHTYTVDGTDPTVELVTPPEAAVYDRHQVVNADFGCADEVGGSGLVSCVGTVADGSPIDTAALGEHEFTVTATDTVANTTVVTHGYTVAYPPHGYPDVAPGAFYEDGLDWAKAEAVVVANFPDGGFHPNDPVNRGQIANMLWTMMDRPPGSPPHGFVPPDVPANAFYDDALDWAKAQGLVTGYTRTVDCRPRPVPCYKPKDPVLRGQLVSMAWNMVGAPIGLPAFTYTDIPATAPYRTAMNWADANGLINEFGAGGTLAQPKRAATRGEVVYILHRVASVQAAWSAYGGTPPSTVLF